MKNALIVLIFSSLLFAGGKPDEFWILNSRGCKAIWVVADSLKIDTTAACTGTPNKKVATDTSKARAVWGASAVDYAWFGTADSAGGTEDSLTWTLTPLCKVDSVGQWTNKFSDRRDKMVDSLVTFNNQVSAVKRLVVGMCDSIKFVIATQSGDGDTTKITKHILRMTP